MINRLPNENIKQFTLRLFRNRKEYGLKSQDICDILNKETGQNWTESKYRKWFATYEEGFVDGTNSNQSEALDEIKQEQIELQKLKFQFQDQKREYTNLIRNQSRFEHLRDEQYKAILELANYRPLEWNQSREYEIENKTGIALLSDWHVGSEFSNSFNSYNIDIFKQRVQTVVQKIIQDGKKNNVNKLICANLGDALNGIIHVSTRVMSGENLIRQIMIAAETFAEVLSKFCNEFEEVKFVNVMGNHSRAISQKDQSIPDESFERLLPWYIESRLGHIGNLEIVQDSDGFIVENIYDKNYVFVHGDLDHVQGCVKSLPQMLGIVPQAIFMGHIHHNTLTEHGTTTVHSSGSLMGSDNYAVSKRYFAKPSQKFVILSEDADDEIVYTYNLN